MRSIQAFTLVGMAWFMACCASDEQLPASSLRQRIAVTGPGDDPGEVQSQGTKLQGTKLQGTKLQGTKLQGTKLQGVALAAVWLDGAVLSGLRPEPPDGHLVPVSGMDFIGATLQGVDDRGQPVELAIGDIVRDPDDPDGEILLYTLLYHNQLSGSWETACEPDADGVQRAIPLGGRWSERGDHQDSQDEFTLACTSGVLAKCARWGYRPWRSVRGVPLAPYHQSCSRMARGDYCGDGTPHTRDGTLIDIYDNLQILTKTRGTGMLFEAAWTPDGAYCVSKARWNVLAAQLLLECPWKLRLPTLSDILNQDSCAMRLSPGPRSDSQMSNASYLQLAL